MNDVRRETKRKLNTTGVALIFEVLRPGADLRFSRGGADFQKVFESFDLFFRSTKLIFRALLKH